MAQLIPNATYQHSSHITINETFRNKPIKLIQARPCLHSEQYNVIIAQLHILVEITTLQQATYQSTSETQTRSQLGMH